MFQLAGVSESWDELAGTSVLGSRVGARRPLPPFLIPQRVPHGFTQDPSTKGLTWCADTINDAGALRLVQLSRAYDPHMNRHRVFIDLLEFLRGQNRNQGSGWVLKGRGALLSFCVAACFRYSVYACMSSPVTTRSFSLNMLKTLSQTVHRVQRIRYHRAQVWASH